MRNSLPHKAIRLGVSFEEGKDPMRLLLQD